MKKTNKVPPTFLGAIYSIYVLAFIRRVHKTTKQQVSTQHHQKGADFTKLDFRSASSNSGIFKVDSLTFSVLWETSCFGVSMWNRREMAGRTCSGEFPFKMTESELRHSENRCCHWSFLHCCINLSEIWSPDCIFQLNNFMFCVENNKTTGVSDPIQMYFSNINSWSVLPSGWSVLLLATKK